LSRRRRACAKYKDDNDQRGEDFIHWVPPSMAGCWHGVTSDEIATPLLIYTIICKIARILPKRRQNH
jgi:hypothetical protein